MLARAFLFTGATPVLHVALLAVKFALVPVALILVLRTPGKPTPIDLALLLYGVVMAVCCLINHTQVLTITLMALDIFIFWALCRWFFVRKSLFPLQATTLILLAFIALNFVLLLWRPGGLWKYEVNGKMYYLLGGNYNNMGKALFMALVSNMLLLRLLPQEAARQRWLFRLCLAALILLSIATLAIVGSMTSLVGISLILIFSIFMLLTSTTHRSPLTANRSSLTALRSLSIVLFVVVYFVLQSWAVFRDQDTDAPKAQYFVEHVLKKDMTFSFRTHVWDAAKRLIERQPVVGYGEHDDQWYQLELEGLTTHNLVLHILLKGGWVCLSAFILLLLTTHLSLLRSSLNAKRSPLHPFTPSPVPRDVAFILLFALWTYLFMQIFEVYSFYTQSMLFIYASCLSSLLPESE
ncbi:MAG: O-antigen ligase family protein [Paludibacteraceae bacterium]|nr:O-antigen ligase family protein [Paludibacteraceae bacterium]